MPHFTHTLSVTAQPSTIFAIMDDFSKTPQWLSRCTGIDKLDDGPNDVGTALKYHYDDGRRSGTMDGRIVAREPDRHFAMKFSDRMMDVTVDFVAASDGVGTTLTHAIDINPRVSGAVRAADQAPAAEADPRRDDRAQGYGGGRLTLDRYPGSTVCRVAEAEIRAIMAVVGHGGRGAMARLGCTHLGGGGGSRGQREPALALGVRECRRPDGH